MVEKEYIGDGVYIQIGNFNSGVKLTTENGVCTKNTIWLDFDMIEVINRYIERIKEDKDA